MYLQRSVGCTKTFKIKWNNSSFLFFEEETNEPSVLCWMPDDSIFFCDPDGHLIEYLAMLDAELNPYLGIIPWNKWLVSKE